MIVIEINIIINGDEITMSANIPYFSKIIGYVNPSFGSFFFNLWWSKIIIP